MKANLSWLQKLVFRLAWKFSSIEKNKMINLKIWRRNQFCWVCCDGVEVEIHLTAAYTDGVSRFPWQHASNTAASSRNTFMSID